LEKSEPAGRFTLPIDGGLDTVLRLEYDKGVRAGKLYLPTYLDLLIEGLEGILGDAREKEWNE